MSRYGFSTSRHSAARSLWRGRLRFAAVAAALLLVLAARAQLQKPETHERIGEVLGEPLPPPATGQLIRLEGVSLDAVEDNTFFRNEEQPAWFGVLDASSEVANLGGPAPVGYAELMSEPDFYRGALVSVRGVVRRVDEVEPAENDAGVERLWRVTLQPEGGGVWPITVYTLEEPPPSPDATDAAVAATGWFFKNLSYRWADGVGVTPVVVARRLERDAGSAPRRAEVVVGEPTADYAFEARPAGSLGRALLEQLGVYPGTLAVVEDKREFTVRERDAFYAVLDAVAPTPATQLVRLAQRGLADYAERQRVGESASRRQRLLADEVDRRAADGRYSVAPLFGDGASQRGELIVVDAVVRRVVRVDLAPDVAPIDRYYELEAFPDDSQNLPLVFCMRELPAGFPVGESVRQPARLAGFVFKQWAYRTRRRGADGGDRRQFAPLLIGRAPIALPASDPPTQPGLAVGAAGVALLAATALWLWRGGRAQRRYEATTLRRMRSAPVDVQEMKRWGDGGTAPAPGDGG